jgi:hypothetical protein
MSQSATPNMTFARRGVQAAPKTKTNSVSAVVGEMTDAWATRRRTFPPSNPLQGPECTCDKVEGRIFGKSITRERLWQPGSFRADNMSESNPAERQTDSGSSQQQGRP